MPNSFIDSIRNAWARLAPSTVLLGGFACIVTAVWAGAHFINAPIDRAILLACNPDAYVPIADEAMILITNYSKTVFAIVYLSWGIAYAIGLKRPELKHRMPAFFLAFATIEALYQASGWFWRDCTLRTVFPAQGLILFVALRWVGQTFVRADEATLHRYARVFWLVLLSVVLTNGLAEGFIKANVGRDRPLAASNRPWNDAIRPLPDDVVRRGYSYASGHASSLFALTAPIFWVVRSRWKKAGLFTWAALHAYSRIYVAAHFPYCALMGSVLGFAIGSWVWYVVAHRGGFLLLAGSGMKAHARP